MEQNQSILEYSLRRPTYELMKIGNKQSYRIIAGSYLRTTTEVQIIERDDARSEMLSFAKAEDTVAPNPRYPISGVDDLKHLAMDCHTCRLENEEMPCNNEDMESEEYGGFWHRINVESDALGLLIGRKGSTKTLLQQRLGVKIDICNDSCGSRLVTGLPKSEKQVQLASNVGLLNDKQEVIENNTSDQDPKENFYGKNDMPLVPVCIWAPSREKVMMAEAHIQQYLANRRRQMKGSFSHFLCVPLYNTEVEAAYERFVQEVRQKNYPGIESSCFQGARKLHFTLMTLNLHDPDKLSAAVETLQFLRPQVTEVLQMNGFNLPSPLHNKQLSTDYSDSPILRLALQGLHIMNDDFSAARVVYTTLVPDGDITLERRGAMKARRMLQDICKLIVDEFQKRQLVSHQELLQQRLLNSSLNTISLNLHATLMNTKYCHSRQPNSSTMSSASAPTSGSVTDIAVAEYIPTRKFADHYDTLVSESVSPGTINVQQLFKDFGDFFFGCATPNRICLNEIGSTGPDGNYVTLSAIPLY